MIKLPWTLYRYVGKELYLIFALSLLSLLVLFMIISGIRGVSEGFSLQIIMPWILAFLLVVSIPDFAFQNHFI